MTDEHLPSRRYCCVPSSGEHLFAMVLAAGTSSRFGSPKQLSIYQGKPLAAGVMRLAEEVCGPRSVLVTGDEWPAVVDACSPLQGFFVINTQYRSGMGSSIAAAVRSVTGAANAVLVLLADQPLIPVAHLDRVIAAWDGSSDRIVATSFEGTSGPPVLFPRHYFTELAELQADQGARAILVRAGDRVSLVECRDAAFDVDRPGDLAALPQTRRW